MPQRYNRLRIHPAAVLGLLLGLGGSTALSYVDTQPWSRWEEVGEVIEARFAKDSLGYAYLNGERLVLHPDASAFYARRGFMPVWTEAAAQDTLLFALRDSEADGLDPSAYPIGGLHYLAGLAPARSTFGDSLRADLDLLLTDAFFRLGDDLVGPNVEVADLYTRKQWRPTRRNIDLVALLTEATSSEDLAGATARAIDRLRPQAQDYRFLRDALARILDARDRWPTLLPGMALSPGDSSVRVPPLRERMEIAGYTPPDGFSPLVYDVHLAEAVRRYQAQHGLDTTAVLDQDTRAALNKRPDDLVPLLRLNLERWRWLPDPLGDFHVFVNLPTYELAVREFDGERFQETLRMKTVIGRTTWATTVMSDTMEQIIFNPTWTIPASIQREQYGSYQGRMVRQPGPGNPMGRAKFRFPNEFAIYIHDTNSRSGFRRETRTLSHGCVRAHRPDSLALAILARTNGWEPDQVEEIFNGPWRQRPVDLDAHVPVHLVYFTAAATPDGGVEVYDDVYGLDQPLADALGLSLLAQDG